MKTILFKCSEPEQCLNNLSLERSLSMGNRASANGDAWEGTLLGSFISPTSSTPSGKRNLQAKPNSSGGGSSTGSARGQASVASTPGRLSRKSSQGNVEQKQRRQSRSRTPPGDTHQEDRAGYKSRGKGSNIPVDIDLLLTYEGYDKAYLALCDETQKFVLAPFDKLINGQKRLEDLRKCCQDGCVVLQKLVGDFQAIDTRFNKRQSTPPDAKDRVRLARGLTRNVIGFLTDIHKSSFDPEKVQNVMEVIKSDCKCVFGVCVHGRVFEMEASEHMRYAKWDLLAKLMKDAIEGAFAAEPTEDVHAVCDRFIEQGLARLIKGALGKDETDQAVLNSLFLCSGALLQCKGMVHPITLEHLTCIRITAANYVGCR